MKWLIILLIGVFLIGCGTPGLQKENKIDNPNAQDVSFAELNDFLQEFQSNECRQVTAKSCVTVAQLLHNTAESKNIRAAIVAVKQYNHLFNLFHTIDKGNIYVDATKGIVGIVYVENGEYLVKKHINGFSNIQRLGKEQDFLIFW